MAMQVYTARYLLPVSAPLLRGGAVAVNEGRIVSVGPLADVVQTAGTDSQVHDLGDAVILPGLVNAHTHLELSWMGDDPPPGGGFCGGATKPILKRVPLRRKNLCAGSSREARSPSPTSPTTSGSHR
jgi:cytosine/adenosine deaminase-related metal-dependent hydrolase